MNVIKSEAKLFLKKRMTTFLVVVGGLFCFSPILSAQNTTTAAETQMWIKQHFAKGVIPPFSFVYDGRSSDTFIKSWQFNSEKLDSRNQNEEERVYTYTDKMTGLAVKCKVTCFTDFPAVEWVLNFVNTSDKNTPLIENAEVINYSFNAREKGNYVFHHAKGSNAERTDFMPIDDTLSVGNAINIVPWGGRSSDANAFPFFNLEMPGKHGVMVGIGWTGRWYANLLQKNEQSVTLKSGMEIMKLMLYPKEEIRTPKVCLLFWSGENRMVGHNQFRRFVLKHHSRMIDGKFVEYPLCSGFDYGDPSPCGEYTCMTENFAISLIERYKYFKVLPEVFWLDAGWSTGCGWDKSKGDWNSNVGNLTIEKERFPNGFKKISQAAHEAGCKFMVWFEPERVMKGTQIDIEHPEWLIKLPGDTYLFDLGNKDACKWLTQYIGDLIQNEGIDYYRQDFNMDPLPFWQANDKPDRVGISEIRHIEGLYAYWDGLLERFPNLLIDNCSSGGRRIDLETTSRSAPLWRTDYQYGEPNGYQCHTFGLNFYLPLHGAGMYKTDNFTFRSSMSAATVMNWSITGWGPESIPDIQRRIKDFKALQPYYYGDFYPLTSQVNNTGNELWLAYQLHRTEEKDGIVLAFRRDGNKDASLKVKLGGLEAKATYEVFNEDSGQIIRKNGRELMEGLELIIPEKPGSLLLKYKQVKD
ncbi:MAG: alpha-galactosidase [Bacteroidota bacterium]|nr:alpha-galactosidase [Bacteroidota bacterium]